MTLDEKYVYGHCYRPVTLSRMFDITKQDYVQRDVPCGKCYHCRMTKVNEWTTRMRLQSATYKNTYFITLTISPDAPPEVLDAHRSVKTTINANHRYCNTPICLDKATPQKFLKRLRRYYDLPSLTYFLVGEYGHKYGRPHYHAILWCDEDITLDMLRNAWQLGGVSIGDIDYHQIMQGYGKITDSTMNPKHAFSYVCKYLQKQDFDWYKLPTINLHYWFDYAAVNHATFIVTQNKITEKYELQFCNYHCPTDSDTWKDLLPDVELPTDTTRVLSDDYIKMYKPFMLCSKSRSIGGRYFESQKERFSRGNFELFGVLDKGLVFPSYFLRKAKQVVCPYFPLTETQKQGIQVACSSCHLPNVETFCNSAHNTPPYLSDINMDCPKDFRTALGCVYVQTDNGTYRQADLTIYDKETRTYLVYNGSVFDRYQYDRHTRKYNIVECIQLETILSKLDKAFKDLLQFVAPFDFARECSARELDVLVKSDFNGSYEKFEDYRKSIEKQIMAQRADRQLIYKQTKNKF